MSVVRLLARSRKFWVALIGMAVVAANELFRLGLDQAQVIAVILPAIALIFGIAIEDAGAKAGGAGAPQ